MLFINIISLAYTTANYKIYSMYDISTDETLIYVDIQEIFAYNLRIIVTNPKTNISQGFVYKDVTDYIKNNYPNLLNHPDLMFSKIKYSNGLFASIDSDMISNRQIDLHFDLFGDKFYKNVAMNHKTTLNLLDEFSYTHENYLKILLNKFNDVCSKIEKIENDCHILKSNISDDQYFSLGSKFRFIFESIFNWKNTINKKDAVDFINTAILYNSNNVNYKAIIKTIKHTNLIYLRSLIYFKKIIGSLDCYKMKLFDDYISSFEDLRNNSLGIFRDYLCIQETFSKISFSDKNQLKEMNMVEKKVSLNTKEDIKNTCEANKSFIKYSEVNKSSDDDDKEKIKSDESKIKNCKICENRRNDSNIRNDDFYNENNKNPKQKYFDFLKVLVVLLVGYLLITFFQRNKY